MTHFLKTTFTQIAYFFFKKKYFNSSTCFRRGEMNMGWHPKAIKTQPEDNSAILRKLSWE